MKKEIEKMPYAQLRMYAKRDVMEMIKEGKSATQITLHLGLNYGLSNKLYIETKEQLEQLEKEQQE